MAASVKKAEVCRAASRTFCEINFLTVRVSSFSFIAVYPLDPWDIPAFSDGYSDVGTFSML